MEAVVYPGFSRGGLWDRSPSAGSEVSAQPLAQFCYLLANVERSEALQVLNFNVHCVCYNQKLAIIVLYRSAHNNNNININILLHRSSLPAPPYVTLSLLAHIFSLTKFASLLLARA